MISTISFANFGSLHKLKALSADSAATDFDPTDFTALFAFPVFSPPTVPPANGAKQNLLVDTTLAGDSAESETKIAEPSSTLLVDQRPIGDTANLANMEPSSTISVGQRPSGDTAILANPDSTFESAANTAKSNFVPNSKETPARVEVLDPKGNYLRTTGISESKKAFSKSGNEPELFTMSLPKSSKQTSASSASVNKITETIGDKSPNSPNIPNKEQSDTSRKRDFTPLPPAIDSSRISVALPPSIDGGTILNFRPARFQSMVAANESSQLLASISKAIRGDASPGIVPDQPMRALEGMVNNQRMTAERAESLPDIVIPRPETTLRSELVDALTDTTEEPSAGQPRIFTSNIVPSNDLAATPNDLNRPVFEQVEPRILEFAAAVRLGSNKKTIKLRLNPQDLGSVEVTLEKSSTGRIDAYIRTETAEARYILGENLIQLRHSLEQAGWNVGELEISHNSLSSNNDGRREADSHELGRSDTHPVETVNFDGSSKTEGENEDRLLNLRA